MSERTTKRELRLHSLKISVSLFKNILHGFSRIVPMTDKDYDVIRTLAKAKAEFKKKKKAKK